MTEPTPTPRGRPLAWHLGVLCAALLVPMLALEAFLLVQMANAERDRHRAEARDTARRVAVSLDRGLTTLQAVLEVLATSDHLRRGDFEALRRRAREVPRSAGTEIAVRDRQGRTLVSTDGPLLGGDPEADRAALETGRPQITDLLPREEGRPWRFAIVAPAVGPGGERDYVIELSVPVKALDDVLGRGEIPAGMTASVVDRRGTILARSAEPERFVGAPLSPGAPARTETRPEGWRRTADANGTVVVLAWSRSEVAGWTTAVFLPERDFEAPLRRLLWSAAALGAVLAALAAALAFVFARRIARPIAALAGVAAGNGAGAAAAGKLATPVREVNEVGRALGMAWLDARAREREREDLLATLDRAQVLVCDAEGRITVWTKGAEHLYGWSREEAIGRVADELLATRPPCPLSSVQADLLARGEWHGELRRRHRDGTALVVSSHWALRRNPDGAPLAVVEVCTDITALREAENALRRSRDLLASVLDGSADPIFAKDAEGRFVLLNRPAAELLGVPVEAALGRRASELLPPAAAAALEKADREVMASGETRALEDEVATPGSERRVLLTTKAAWRDAEGQTVGVIGVSRDITARRRAEALVEARRREMERLQAELLHVSRLSEMGAMATALAHELNQPLTAVANFADAGRRLLAGDAASDPERLEAARDAMAEAAEQAVRAGQIVRRLRGFFSQGDADKRPTDINALVGEAAALALVGTREQGVEARLDLDPGAPPALADRVQIQQVVVNLVRNAVEALRDAPRRELVVATAAAAGAVRVSVADTGPGLPEDVVERLFEPFVSTKRHGMGVGLSLCRSIVEDHGGRLWAEANPGGGAVFRFVVPAMPAPASPGEVADAG
ncbi:hypothetical protein GCM10009416_00410 [Craurococcus roseus]|uniref:histidine kinase n=1 Tax=Craurococcus roseus TaxID=77585 RepID=A0ABN1EII4_9PROT